MGKQVSVMVAQRMKPLGYVQDADSEVIFQLLRNYPQYILPAAHTLLLDSDMAAATDHARTDCPNVEIMHFQIAK